MTKPEPWEWVQLTANYDGDGGMPEEIDHIQTRGAHPEAITDPANLRGISRQAHHARHQYGRQPKPRLTLKDVWLTKHK